MAKYNKSWGSVSSDFKRTTGFQSETKRISKQAEDQFRKEKDQLASMKEVAAHNSRADRSAASFADKAANHELQALSQFSGKLNSFLQTTAAEWAKEEKAKDINRKIDKIKKDRVDYNKKSGEIRSQIEAAKGNTKKQEKIFEDMRTKEEVDRAALESAVNKIAENNTAVQQLQKDLDAHNLLDPNNPDNVAKLSGNEKIAYYAVTAEQKVNNAEAGYYQYVTDHGEREVVATWLPKETVKDGLGNDVEQHPLIRVKDITTPQGKQYLKDEYRDHVMNDMSSQLGGIKEDYRILLLDEPLTAELDSIQSTEVQQYKQDKHKDLHAASIKGVENAINGTPPYNNEEALGKNFNSAYASSRSSFPASGQGSPSTGLDKLMETALTTVTGQVDVDKMDDAWLNYQRIGEQVITSGPHKGEKFKDAHPNRWNLAKAQEAYGKARADAKNNFVTIEKGIIEGKVAGIEDKITNAKTEAKNEEPPRTLSVDEIKNLEAQEFRDILKDHPTETAAALIFELQGDSRKAWSDDDWENEYLILGEQYRGVIPTYTLRGMPKSIQDELKKKYPSWRVVDQPAAISGHQKEATERHLKEINTALTDVEINLGQTKGPDNDRSVIVRDFAGDLYERELNRLVYEVPDEEKLSPIDAGKQARQYVLNMITSNSPVLEDGTTPNPLYAKRDTEGVGGYTVWRTNSEVNQHRARGNRLSTGPMETQWVNARTKYNDLKQKGPVNLSSNYLFVQPALDGNGNVKNIDNLTAVLGTGLESEGNEFGGHVVTETYRKVSRSDSSSRGDFLHKQRVAVLAATSNPPGDPTKSSLWTSHPELMKKWFTDERASQEIGNQQQYRREYDAGKTTPVEQESVRVNDATMTAGTPENKALHEYYSTLPQINR